MCVCVLVWDRSIICSISCYDPGGFSHVFTGQIHFTHLSQTEGWRDRDQHENHNTDVSSSVDYQ